MRIPVAEFWVDQQHYDQTRFVDSELDTDDLVDGELLLRLDRFSFTTNNISYIAVGDDLHYWAYFPAPDNWGKPPVWGHATVMESRHPEVANGERVFGYFPMASHLRILATHVKPGQLTDGAAHRAALAEQHSYARIYNNYVRLNRDPSHRAENEDLEILFRPLFYTSFLLADFADDNQYFGAEQVVITSASSKTSYATASELSRIAKALDHPPSRVGLTSGPRQGFVEELGFYDQVVSYQSLDELDAQRPTLILDMAGNPALSNRLMDHFGDALRHFAVVGATHVGQGKPQPLAGRAAFFFAATQALKRGADWGTEALMTHYAQAWATFAPKAREMVEFVHCATQDEVVARYQQVLDGDLPAEQGVTMSLTSL